MGDSLQPQQNIFSQIVNPYLQMFDFMKNVYAQHRQERKAQKDSLEKFPSADAGPWDFWGNISRFYGLGGMPGLPRSGTYVNPQWGGKNIKTINEILEE
jgi:hypothetical protein